MLTTETRENERFAISTEQEEIVTNVDETNLCNSPPTGVTAVSH
jgi:hypothetical protein